MCRRRAASRSFRLLAQPLCRQPAAYPEEEPDCSVIRQLAICFMVPSINTIFFVNAALSTREATVRQAYFAGGLYG
jgi:hypothetical protein